MPHSFSHVVGCQYIAAVLHQVLPSPPPGLRPHLGALAMQGEQLLDRANAGGEKNGCELRDICRFVNLCAEGNVGDVRGILGKGMLALGRRYRGRHGDGTEGMTLEQVEELLWYGQTEGGTWISECGTCGFIQPVTLFLSSSPLCAAIVLCARLRRATR